MTYGIYFLASFLYMDPWHMFTSSWAYFAGMTCSINDTGPGRTEERLEEVANTLVHREIKCTSSEGVLDKVKIQPNPLIVSI
jgi:hypothetical protein